MRANLASPPDTIADHLDNARYFGTLADDLLYSMRMACADIPEPARTGMLAIQRAIENQLADALSAIEHAQDLAKVQS